MNMQQILVAVILFSLTTAPGFGKGKVFVQCTASQGNGFDWASTLAWMSGQIWQTAKRAQAYRDQNSGARVWIDVSCHSGSSSSGVLAVLVGQLLDNPRIAGTKGNGERKLLSISQALTVSKALLFLSVSSDLHAHETLRLGLAAVSSRLGDNREPENNPLGLRPWSGAAGSEQVLSLFLKWVYGARAYDSLLADTPVSEINLMTSSDDERWSAWEVAMANRIRADFRLQSLIDAPTYLVRPRDVGLDERRPLSKPINKRAHLNRVMIEVMKTARSALDRLNEDADLEEILEEELPEDFCVSVFLIEADETTKPPLDYDRLKLIYICNERTYRKLKSSAALRSMLDRSAIMKRRIYLGLVSTIRNALNITVREPELLPVLTGRLNDPHIGLTRVSKFSGGRFRDIDLSATYLIVGGFPGPRMNSWAPTALLVDRVARLKRNGYEVDARFASFGKIDIRDRVESFAERVIVTYFKSRWADLDDDELLRRFHDWQDEYCSVSAVLRADIVQEFFRMDWNVAALPAGLADASFILTAKGANLHLIQGIDRNRGDIQHQRFRYDPIDSEKFIPEPTARGLPCAGPRR